MAASLRSACCRKFRPILSNLRSLEVQKCNLNIYPSKLLTVSCQSPGDSVTFRRSRATFTPHHQARTVDNDEDEELDYNIDEGKIDDLRRHHRDHVRSQTMVDHGKKFSDFPISESLLRRLSELGYHEPFNIQAETLQHTLTGKDVIGRAFTGSGKTLAFSIPIVETIIRKNVNCPKNHPRAIVISPTRELCLQLYRSVQELNPSIRCLPIYGGESLMKQQRMIQSRGVDIVCATPGRLRDHLERGIIGLDHVEFLCLDEADHLLTPDFLVQIENVLQNSPKNKQVMLFSATMPSDIKSITKRYMSDAIYVDLTTSQNKGPVGVRHLCMQVPRSYHTETVKELVTEHKPERCIIFIRTKALTRQMAAALVRAGLNAAELHSDLTQSRRSNILSAFRTGMISILVATDVAARGLDVPEVDLVIQVEPPANGTDFYIHRSGRTGRAGRDGLAVMIHCGSPDERKVVEEIGRLVPLEYANPPNFDKMQVNKMYKALKTLEEMPAEASTSALPLLEKVELNEANSRRLLAAAITLLRDSDLLSVKKYQQQDEFDDQNQFRDRQGFRDRYPRNQGYRSQSRPDYNRNSHYQPRRQNNERYNDNSDYNQKRNSLYDED